MFIFITALHIFVSIVLVLVIILQPGKGGDMGGAFGGGAATAIFGPQGPTNLLQRATTACAVLFMFTSMSLAWFSNRETMANADVRGALKEQQEKRKAKEAEEAPALEAIDAPEGAGEPIELNLETPPAGEPAPGGTPAPAGAAPAGAPAEAPAGAPAEPAKAPTP